jgi:MYXO-CTERM domain-containing protein
MAVSNDGGATFRKTIAVASRLTAFLRRADDSVLVTGLTAAGSGIGYRSSDGGATFAPWSGIPAIRALAERDGRLYAAADFIRDNFALGVSVDDGVTFRPVMTFSDVKAVNACEAAACADPCNYQAGIGLWPATTCDPVVAPPPPPLKRKHTGCGCAVDAHPHGALGFLVVAAALSLLRARRRCPPVTGAAAQRDRPSP